jgi:hypothetical protein
MDCVCTISVFGDFGSQNVLACHMPISRFIIPKNIYPLLVYILHRNIRQTLHDSHTKIHFPRINTRSTLPLQIVFKQCALLIMDIYILFIYSFEYHFKDYIHVIEFS